MQFPPVASLKHQGMPWGTAIFWTWQQELRALQDSHPFTSEMPQMMEQFCPQADIHHREGLQSVTSPVSSTEAGSTPRTLSCGAQATPPRGKLYWGGVAGPCSVPTLPLAYSYLCPTGPAATPRARFLQRRDELHRAPGASETHWRMSQLRPQTESHPKEGLLSSDGPPSGTEAGSTACPAISRPTLPGKACSGGGLAGPSLCPWPTALCPPHVPLPPHTQWLATSGLPLSGWHLELCPGLLPAAASQNSHRRGMRLPAGV